MRSMKMARVYCDTEVNTVLCRCLCTADGNGYPISVAILQTKVLLIAETFEVETGFKASNIWLDKWKNQHNIKSYAICGKYGNVDISKAEDWKALLASLLDGYIAAGIFKSDKT